jgi:hypothetical protein
MSITLSELTKKSMTLFIAKLDDSTIAGYILYSHTKLEGFSRIIKVYLVFCYCIVSILIFSSKPLPSLP